MTLLALFTALAQSPISLSPSPLTLDAGPPVEVMYVAADKVVSKRFFDDAAPGHVDFVKGDDVRVLYRANGWIRVRDGEKYGWLPETALTAERPEMPAAPQPSTPIEFNIP